MRLILGLRARAVAERRVRLWSEKPRGLILLAMDAVGWTNLVQLSNIGQLSCGDWCGPRLQWHDLAQDGDGLICVADAPPSVSPLPRHHTIARCSNPLRDL